MAERRRVALRGAGSRASASAAPVSTSSVADATFSHRAQASLRASTPKPRNDHDPPDPPAARRCHRGSRHGGGGLRRAGDRRLPAGPWHRPAGAAAGPAARRDHGTPRAGLRPDRRALPGPGPAGAGRQDPRAGTRQRHGPGRPLHPARRAAGAGSPDGGNGPVHPGRSGSTSGWSAARFPTWSRRSCSPSSPTVARCWPTTGRSPPTCGAWASGGAGWSPAAGSRRSPRRWRRSRPRRSGARQPRHASAQAATGPSGPVAAIGHPATSACHPTRRWRCPSGCWRRAGRHGRRVPPQVPQDRPGHARLPPIPP